MESDVLQIKRVTANWDTHKTYIPSKGEYVLINVDKQFSFGTPPYDYETSTFTMNSKDKPFFIVGDGSHTIEELTQNNNNLSFCAVSDILNHIYSFIEQHSTNDTPQVVSTVKDAKSGSSTQFAKADHIHGIQRGIIETTLGVSDSIDTFHCRRIMTGNKDVTEITNAQVGDIYIKY